MTDNRLSRRTTVAGLVAGIVSGTLATAAHGRARAPAAGGGSGGPQAGVELNLTDFGVSPSATPQQNRSRFQRAVASAPSGATVRLPPTGSEACSIDTSGGWSGAILIDRPITLRIDGDLKATHSAVRPNPPFMLNITAPGVTVLGTGRIIGDGSVDDTNAGSDEVFPGLIRVAADDFTMTGVEIVSPPKVGLMLYHCQRSRVQRVRFSGGPKVYGDTAHFAIRAAGGGHHLFEGNSFYPDADGGMAVQCIMLSGSHDNVMTGNHALHPYEKLIYGYGDRNVAEGNTVVGNPGFIPGTNISGTITGVIRFHGSFNRVLNNRTRDCAGGVQLMGGTAHTVENNHFLSCGQSAITAYQGDLSGSTFKGNVGTHGALAGFVAGDGIRLVSDKPARRVLVEDNQISGFSVPDPIAAIAQWRAEQPYGRNSVVKPSAGNGRYYVAQRKGASGTREPEWPATPGTTVIDGTMSWLAMAYEGGQAEIKIVGPSAADPVTDSEIVNNTTNGGRFGIATRFVTASRIAGNLVEASEWAMVEESGAHNVWEANRVGGTANRQVRGLDPTSSERH